MDMLLVGSETVQVCQMTCGSKDCKITWSPGRLLFSFHGSTGHHVLLNRNARYLTDRTSVVSTTFKTRAAGRLIFLIVD